jgi:hypothetical protein
VLLVLLLKQIIKQMDYQHQYVDVAEDNARTEYYRQRISAFYRHYQPDKPASHVEFLLCKYKGLEEDVLATLREKYGPEPAADGSLFLGGSGSPNRKPTIGIHREGNAAVGGSPGGNTNNNNDVSSILNSSAHNNASNFAIDEAHGNLMRQLEEKQNIFQRDMWLLQEQSKRAEAAAIGVSLQDARKVAQKQEVELQQLRHTLSALKSEYTAKAEAQKDAIEKASRELTLAKLRHMQASMVGSSSLSEGPRVPADEMIATTDAIEQVNVNLKATVDYGRKLVSILQKHLFLYPMSPVRMTLEELDPSLAARLEVNMTQAQAKSEAQYNNQNQNQHHDDDYY